jgi:hypothetical protein
MMIKSILGDTIPKGLTFHPYVLVLNQKISFKALEPNYQLIKINLLSKK